MGWWSNSPMGGDWPEDAEYMFLKCYKEKINEVVDLFDIEGEHRELNNLLSSLTLEEIKNRVDTCKKEGHLHRDSEYGRFDLLYAIPYTFLEYKCTNLSDEVKEYLKELLKESILTRTDDVESLVNEGKMLDDRDYFLYELELFYQHFGEIICGNASINELINPKAKPVQENTIDIKKYDSTYWNDIKNIRVFFEQEGAHKYLSDVSKLIDKSLFQDKDFVLELLKIDGNFYLYASEELRKDMDVISAMLETEFDYNIVDEGLPDFFWKDKALILKFSYKIYDLADYENYWPLVDKNLWQDKEFCLEAGILDYCALTDFINPKFLKDKDFVLKLLKNNGSNLSAVDKSLLNDQEVLLMAIANSYDVECFCLDVLSNIPKPLFNNKDFVIKSLKCVGEQSLSKNKFVDAFLEQVSEDIKNNPQIQEVAKERK